LARLRRVKAAYDPENVFEQTISIASGVDEVVHQPVGA
jgi:hypothetical protein